MTKKTSNHAVDQLLDDLFPQNSETGTRVATEVQWIQASLIDANPFQPRKNFPNLAQQKLLKSLIEQGQLQPILVRPYEEGRFQIVAGERRWRAVRNSDGKISQLLCVVRPLSDYESLVASWHENDDRENINPLETAQFFLRLGIVSLGTSLEEAESILKSGKVPTGFPWDEVATAVGLGKRSVRRYIDLLKLSSQFQDWFIIEVGDDSGAADTRSAKLRTEKHGRALLMLSGNANLQNKLLGEIESLYLTGDAAIERAKDLRDRDKSSLDIDNHKNSYSVPGDTIAITRELKKFQKACEELHRLTNIDHSQIGETSEIWKEMLEQIEPVVNQLKKRVES